MKTIKMPLLACALAVCAASPMQAQLLNKINKINRTANQVNNAAETAKAASDVAKGAKNKVSGGLKLDWNMYQQTPAVTMSSLLYGTSIGDGGLTRLANYTATFVPNKTAGGTQVNPIHDQADFLKVKVYKNNQYLNYFEYDGGQQFDEGKKIKYNEPTSRYMRNGEWASGTDIDAAKNGPGNYRLDFYAGDKMYYSFDFEIAKLTNNDPYASLKDLYVLRGPWSNYAYMNYAESGNLIFGYYINHEEFQPNPANPRKTTKSVKWSVKMSKDGKPFAQNYGNGANTAQVERGQWKEEQCAFKLVDKPGEVKFSSLTDGKYKVELSIEGEAKPRVYNFDVKDKRIVQIAEQDRTKNTDPTRLIEGWNDYFWMKLQK